MRKWALIIIGSITWSLTMVKSGLVGEYGIGFWGPNGHDGVWHLALIESITRGSFFMPVFSGEAIKNYHLGFDVLISGLHQITGISVSLLYFQIIPPLLALLIGFFCYTLVKTWTNSTSSAWWSTFFVYFGGSLAWLVGGGESHFWAQQSISTLVNPPYALSLLIMLLGLLSLSKKKYFAAIVCFSLLLHIKVYAGLLSYFGLLVSGIKNHANWKVLFVTLLISVPLFLIINPNSQSLILWKPGWFLESLFAPDRLDVPKLFSALNTYRVGNIWPKAIPAFGLAFIIFWIGNMGSRLLKEVILIKWLRSAIKIGWIEYFLLSVIVSGALIPMFFVQKGTAWNTIQFFYYSLFFSSILSGLSVALVFSKIKSISLKLIISLLLILITLPTTLITLGQYLPSRPPAKLAMSEYNALKLLSNLPAGTVLTIPFDKYLADQAISNPPRPLYLYESTAYISAFSGQPSYLADEVNLNITNYDWLSRRQNNLLFFDLDAEEQLAFLKKNSIKYIYLVGKQNISLPMSALELLYSSADVYLFRLKD